MKFSRGVAALAVPVLASLAACSVGGGSTKPAATGASSGSKVVTLVTHESWVMDGKLAAEFTKRTGYTLKVSKSGDAGQVANKLVLSKGNPSGDVVFGIDNTFASRVAKAGVLESYSSKRAPASAARYALPDGQGKGLLTPIDTASVCVNVDDAWFARKKMAKPASFADLVRPEYKNLMVAPGASSSAPGMGFLLATIGSQGENGWQAYWSKLMANGLKLTSGWSDAWNVDYSAAEGKGPRPIVVSYDSSPAFTVDAAGKSTTSALLDTCFRANEYAGVLRGAKNPEGAKAFIDFMYGKAFQQALPTAMYAFPVDASVTLPKEWAANAKQPSKTIEVSPADIDSKREQWLTAWKDVTSK